MTTDPVMDEDFQKNFDESRNKIRAREGCLHLELWLALHQANFSVTHSHWELEDALNAYRNSELFRTAWKKQKPCFRTGLWFFG